MIRRIDNQQSRDIEVSHSFTTYSLLLVKFNYFDSTLEIDQLDSLPRENIIEGNNSRNENWKAYKRLHEVRKNCDDSGILFVSLLLQNRMFVNFYFSLTKFFLCLETLFSLCTYRNIYFINFILHSCEQFFYIHLFFFFFYFFLFLSARGNCLQKQPTFFPYTFQRFYHRYSIHLYLPVHSSNLRRITFLIFRSNVYRKYK